MKKILASLLSSIPLLMPLSVSASEIQDHQYLMNTLQSVGVVVNVNTADCNEDDIYGSYRPLPRPVMLICQEEAKNNIGVMVGWTDEDLDTLRHESQHVIQDCLAGRMGDPHFSPMFQDQQELSSFIAKSPLTKQHINQIVSEYTKQGVPPQHIIMELEAFAVASSISARLIANKVTEFCSR